MKTKIIIFLSALAMISIAAAKPDPYKEAPEKYWDFSMVEKVPSFRDAPEIHQVKGLRGIFVEGFGPKAEEKDYFLAAFPKPLKEKTKSEFFAYIGIPSTPMPNGGYPGIVLIHGGGGTAFPGWTKMWVEKGFVVISIDWLNQKPIPKNKEVPTNITTREAFPGGKRQDHISSVANMALAHSLLRSMKEVNPEKTAFVGLSWGSYYGTMLASFDKRFKGGVLIYCGGKNYHSHIFNGRFLHASKIPLYWIVGTHDQVSTLTSLYNAFKTCQTITTKSIVLHLPHSHIGFEFDACFRMAKHYTTGEVPMLPKLSNMTINGDIASCKILNPGKGIKNAWLCYTADDQQPQYHLRKWGKIPAEIKNGTITAKIPAGAYMYYITAYEGESKYHDLCGSTDPVVKPYPGKKIQQRNK